MQLTVCCGLLISTTVAPGGPLLHLFQRLKHASLPAGDASTPVVPPSGYKYEAQVEFVDHVTAADPKGSFAAAAVQEVCPALQ